MRGRMARARKGLPLRGCSDGYGHVWDAAAELYRAHPEEARVVQTIFTLCARGTSLRAICRKLSEDKIPRPSSPLTEYAEWPISTVSRLLRDTRFIGKGYTMKRQRVKLADGATVLRARPLEEQIPLEGRYEPIIEPDLFATVQQRIASNVSFASRNSGVADQCLLRLKYLYCAVCRRPMGAYGERWSRQGRHTDKLRYWPARYRCENLKRDKPHSVQINAPALDATVWKAVCHIMQSPELILDGIRAMLADEEREQQELTTVDGLLKGKRADLATLTKNAGELALSPDINPLVLAGISQQMTQVEDAIAGLERERAALLAQRSEWEAALENAHELERYYRELAGDLAGLQTIPERQMVLDALRVRVMIHPNGSEPRWELGFAPDLGLPTFRAGKHDTDCVPHYW
jgi:hypothetical protein